MKKIEISLKTHDGFFTEGKWIFKHFEVSDEDTPNLWMVNFRGPKIEVNVYFDSGAHHDVSFGVSVNKVKQLSARDLSTGYSLFSLQF